MGVLNDKYAKEIAKELKLIRKELQKINNRAHVPVSIDGEVENEYVTVFNVDKGKIENIRKE